MGTRSARAAALPHAAQPGGEQARAYALLRSWEGARAEELCAHGQGVQEILQRLGLGPAEQALGILQAALQPQSSERLEALESQLGPDAGRLATQLQQLSRASYLGSEESRAEHMRQMILASVNDPRVILILFAERLQALREAKASAAPPAREMARESEAIYAPIAHRLGIEFIRSELEDLSFAILEPAAHTELLRQVRHLTEEGQAHLNWLKLRLARLLEENGIRAEISGRLKGLRSLHAKMQRQQAPLERIYDLLAARVIVDTEEQCYRALGLIHAQGTPVPGRFKDYIALPKANGYRSLHTTVTDPQGGRFEIQIRTHQMHRESELGVAAHFGYKYGGGGDPKELAALQWFRSMLEHFPEGSSVGESVELLGRELIADQLFLFSPKGEVVKLPPKATAVDFAYSIHTRLGETCIGARMDGRMISIRTLLKNGSMVEILTSSRQRPKREWLDFAVSAKARSRIRSALRLEEHTRVLRGGKEAIHKLLRRQGLRLEALLEQAPMQGWMQRNNLHSAEELFVAQGVGRVNLAQALIRLAEPLGLPAPAGESAPQQPPKAAAAGRQPGKALSLQKQPGVQGLSVENIEGVPTRLARCCAPVSGDPVVGLISRGRGISVHHSQCSELVRQAPHPQRMVQVRWEGQDLPRSPVHLMIEGGLPLREMLGLVSLMEDEQAEVTDSRIHAHQGRQTQQITLLVHDYAQVQRILARLNAIEGISARRTLNPA